MQLHRHPHQNGAFEHDEQRVHRHHGVAANGVIQQEHAHTHRLQHVKDDMVRGDRDRRRDHDAPVAIHQEEGERREYVEVRLDHPVRLMNKYG